MMICLIPRTGIIYLIKCNKTGKIYVGSSFDMRERINKHKINIDCKSKIIIDTGDYEFIELFSVNVYSKQELNHYERKIIRFYKKKYNDLCVNYKDRYENGKEQKQEYHQNNKDKINEYQAEYRTNNADKIRDCKKEQNKKYYENNKQHKKDYYEMKVIKSWLDDLINKIDINEITN
jgi:predicted GIY-YIG superfamily endonuclease